MKAIQSTAQSVKVAAKRRAVRQEGVDLVLDALDITAQKKLSNRERRHCMKTNPDTTCAHCSRDMSVNPYQKCSHGGMCVSITEFNELLAPAAKEDGPDGKPGYVSCGICQVNLTDLFRVQDGRIYCNKCNFSNPLKYGSGHYTDCALFGIEPWNLLAKTEPVASLQEPEGAIDLLTPLARNQITPEIADLARKAVASHTVGMGHSVLAAAGIYAAYTIIRERQLLTAMSELHKLRSDMESDETIISGIYQALEAAGCPDAEPIEGSRHSRWLNSRKRIEWMASKLRSQESK